MEAALAAYDEIYADKEEESNKAWVALASLQEGKTADEQLNALWHGLGSRKSPALLKLALEKRVKPTGD